MDTKNLFIEIVTKRHRMSHLHFYTFLYYGRRSLDGEILIILKVFSENKENDSF